jgi:FkbM family methyltransferase
LGLLRTVLERASRNRILKRRLPGDLGGETIYVSPDAALSFWKPGLRSDLFDLAREFVKPGDTVWDIGANVGLFSAAAAQRAGKSGHVLAVEADIWLVSLLRKTSAGLSAGSARMDVLPAAIFKTSGIASFNIANRGRASNFLASETGESQTGGVRESVQVVTVTLDWLLEQGKVPAVVKVDVEGAELDVFRAANRLLSEARPVILCEVQARSRAEMTALFKQHHYELYDWESNPRMRVELAADNTLAIPR